MNMNWNYYNLQQKSSQHCTNFLQVINNKLNYEYEIMIDNTKW